MAKVKRVIHVDDLTENIINSVEWDGLSDEGDVSALLNAPKIW